MSKKKFLLKKVRLVFELAKAAGPEGMVGGQVADMEAEGKRLTIDELEYIHKHKTGKLLEFAAVRYFLMRQKSKKKSCLRLPNISV